MSTEHTILSNLLYNDEYARRVLPFLADEYFTEAPEKALYNTFNEYWEKYNMAPTKEALRLEVTNRDDINDDQFNDAIGIIDENLIEDFPNMDWLVDTTEEWCQEQAISKAVMDSISIIDGDDETRTRHAIPDLLKEALGVSFSTEVGHDYFDDSEDRYDFYHEEKNRLPFDIELLNKITNGGVTAGTLNVILAGTNVGKSHPHSSTIRVPDGRTITFGELEVGDHVIGRDGAPTMVQGVFEQGVRDIYEIKFSDGRVARCCAEHLWNIILNNGEERTVDLTEINRLLAMPTYRNRLYIPLCAPVEYHTQTQHIIDPYIMGIYIGDGTTSCPSSFGISSADTEVLENIMSLLPDDMKLKHSSNYDYRIVHSGVKSNRYLDALRDLNLHGNLSNTKFIPNEYLTSSIDNRIKLLRGLLDSDGHVGVNRTLHYYTTSSTLASNVVELVRGLGGIAVISDKVTYCNGNRCDSFVVGIRLQPELKTSLNLISRKQDMLNGATKPLKLRIDSIRKVEAEPSRCIKVDAPDSLFLIGDFLVTHNTLFMVHMASGYLRKGKNVLYITLEMAEEEIAKRVDANNFDMPIGKVDKISRDKYAGAIQRIRSKTNGKLIIKQFPTGSAHVGHFRTLLQELWLKKNFKPDAIVVDYIGICASSRMKMGNTSSYFYIKAVAEELRGLGIEFEVPVWTAVQTTRTGFSSNDVDITDTAESFGLPATADLMLAAMRTDELDKLNQMIMKQLKNRYANKNVYTKFLIGSEFEKQKLFDVDNNAQEKLNDHNSPDGDEELSDQEADPTSNRKRLTKRKKNKFKDYD